jgi:hypothetical protein
MVRVVSMKLIVGKKCTIPRSFARDHFRNGLVAEADIYPQSYGRLAAKLLIFDTTKSLRSFWRDALGHDLGSKCLGAVNALAQERTKFTKGKPETTTLHVDRRYFCIIGLVKGYLNSEIISHEATHAGFAYHKRVKRNVWGKIGDFDEEQVAYPTGRITDAINRFLHRKKIYT